MNPTVKFEPLPPDYPDLVQIRLVEGSVADCANVCAIAAAHSVSYHPASGVWRCPGKSVGLFARALTTAGISVLTDRGPVIYS